jgi:antitoxin (DNA-binding transcriptional repressor) of toxin-antitoxin stability system
VIAVGVRDLKNRLSHYLRLVTAGEEILVTDHGQVIAELRKPGRAVRESPFPALLQRAQEGTARLGAPNRPDLYPPLSPILPAGAARRLLDEERGER